MTRALFVAVAVLVLGIAAVQYTAQLQPANFAVKYYATYTSGSGDRILDITYSVKNGMIVSCEGTYSFPPSQAQRDAGITADNQEPCDVNTLRNNQYNVPLNLITRIGKMSDEVTDGDFSYRYQVILE